MFDMEKQKNSLWSLKTLKNPTSKEKIQYLKGVALFEDNQRINEKDAYLLVGTNE